MPGDSCNRSGHYLPSRALTATNILGRTYACRELISFLILQLKKVQRIFWAHLATAPLSGLFPCSSRVQNLAADEEFANCRVPGRRAGWRWISTK